MTVHCGRCRRQVNKDDAEFCWYCLGYLCSRCWSDFGHCGHVEAEEANARARLCDAKEEA